MSRETQPAPDATPTPRKPSAARERLLATAGRLFYAEGIHTVGVDRVISEAQITRATFYRHFASKEDLVVACLQIRDDTLRAQAAGLVEGQPDPSQALAAIIEGVGRQLTAKGFRGCPFINAGAEYPDSAAPVRQVVEAHRTWFRGTIAELLASAGHPDPEYAADLLVMLRDGGQVAAYLGDPSAARTAFLRSAAAVFG
ncbi:MAG: TetR/AcrR family transcriptional regulator [Solirubrobacteraceae bacterium]|nr:TetR/AcrR family transcriptional regulator [Solirubrobacteraceae bacterium]